MFVLSRCPLFPKQWTYSLTDRGIEPHIPVWDKSTRNDGTFSRADFTFDAEQDRYTCPGGKTLKTTGRVHESAST